MSLRKELIKLAHEKPELREHILPLITKSAKKEVTFEATKTVKLPTIENGKLTLETCKKGETESGVIELEMGGIRILRASDGRLIILEKKYFTALL
tara:strand:- start:498 stop:785 length:288 start_codon:yes stop_codon:yes gene_type:complete